MTNTIAKRQNGTPTVNYGSVLDSSLLNSFRRFFDDNFWETGPSMTTGTVPINMRDNGQHYQLDVVAPGCKKEDFKIEVKDKLLTVSFNRNDEKKEQAQGWERNEFMQHSFSRSFSLDDTVDLNQLSASYTDGILRINLPKNEKAKEFSKTIEIQ